MRSEADASVVMWMDSFQRDELGISAISVAEILYSISALTEDRRKQRLLVAAGEMFEKDFAERIYGFDGSAAIEYADIVIRRERIGRPISMPDAQIASICRVLGCPLATRNIKYFDNTHIELINPWEG